MKNGVISFVKENYLVMKEDKETKIEDYKTVINERRGIFHICS